MTDQEPIKGLTTGAAQGLQERYGKNQLAQGHNQSFFGKVIHIICEPMFLLLLAAGALYFISGEPINTAIMLALVVGIISIDVLQGRKTDKTLNALKDLTALHSVVLRDGKEKTIASRDLVPGDVVLIDEGVKIPADGPVLKQNNLRVDESSITGEAAPAWKVCRCNAKPSADHWRRDYCYAGTLVTHGNGYILVEKIGSLTEYGKIASHVASAPQDPPPLRKQTSHMVRLCAGISAVLFASVSLISWMNIPDLSFSNRLIGSILSGITLAMAMIPEEFPVILTVFLSMGAWRLAKKGSVVVHNLPAVETLGAVSVLCVDKTGIITMDHVTVQDTWAVDGNTAELCEIMGLACETEAHSPMEKAMLSHCEKLGIRRGHLLSGELLNEYAFSNNLKMMGHVWRHDGEILIAAKGSPDRLLTICGITDAERQTAESRIAMMSQEGLSVIAVAVQRIHAEGEIPSEISGCSLILRGLAGLADPPRENVKANIALCCKAGIRVVMITDDNPLTAASIARQVGVPNYSNVITGEELDALTNEDRKSVV